MPDQKLNIRTDEAHLNINEIERTIGMQSWEWPGRCFDVARTLLQETGLDGRTVYGFWTGPVTRSTFYDGEAPRVRHGWIVTPAGLIIDPTRFVFEHSAPYIYSGPNDYYADGQAINWQVSAPVRCTDTPQFRARPRSRSKLKPVRVRSTSEP